MAYNSALFNVSLAGPTLFGHVVTHAAQIASGSVARNERKYFVLLIITVYRIDKYTSSFTVCSILNIFGHVYQIFYIFKSGCILI